MTAEGACHVQRTFRVARLPLLALAFVALIGSAQARTGDTDLIVGFWNYGGGVVQVTGGPTSFTGRVVKATTFSSCAHPVGEVMWRITKSGTGYVGTHSWFAANDCKPGSAGYGKSTWSIVESGTSYLLHFCTTSPNDSSDTRCNDLTRAKPVAAPWPPLPDALVSLASVSNGCGGGVASGESRMGDTSTYLNTNNPLGKRYPVNFRMACNLHDAGYSGAKVRDPLHGNQIVDFFYNWSQLRVDDKFLGDMRMLCRDQIPASAPGALADCLGNGGKTSFGAKSRYDFVRFRGHKYYRARPDIRGVWSNGTLEVVISQNGRTIRGTWTDEDLKGELRGTLISQDQDSLVKGSARTTTPDAVRQTTIWIDIDPDSPDEIKITGAALTGTFTR